MEGKSPEFISIEKIGKTDNGFSEKRAARIIEGKQQDNSQMKKRVSAVKQQKTNPPRKQIRFAQPLIRKHKVDGKKVLSRRDII